MGFKDAAKPHYLGHRERLRTRFRDAGPDALPDYELIELILFRAMPRRDTKPLAKALLARFGTFAEAVNAPEELLREVPGIGDAAITELKLVRAAALRLMRGEVLERPVLSSWAQVLDYCRASMGFEAKEQFRILFLDKRNQIIADEVQQKAPSTIPRYMCGRWSNGRWSCRPRPSCWCTTTPRAIRRLHAPISR